MTSPLTDPPVRAYKARGSPDHPDQPIPGSPRITPGSVGSPEDWQVRLQAAIAVHTRRKALRALARGEMQRAREYGLRARHAQKIHRANHPQEEL
jgi:hypothetical protein